MSEQDPTAQRIATLKLPPVPPWDGSYIVPHEIVFHPGDTVTVHLEWDGATGSYVATLALIRHSG